VCNKALSQQSSLVTHTSIHSGERPYVCDVCNKSFMKKSDLITHKRIHSGERPHVCDVCYKAFSDWSSVIKHKHIVVSAFILVKCVIRRSVNRAI
jgi:uncharacterized Zn-finger protein